MEGKEAIEEIFEQNMDKLYTDTDEKLEINKEISDLTKKIKNMWLELSDAEESVEEKRKNMIRKLKKEQMKTTTINKIFAIEFKVV